MQFRKRFEINPERLYNLLRFVMVTMTNIKPEARNNEVVTALENIKGYMSAIETLAQDTAEAETHLGLDDYGPELDDFGR